MSRFPVFRAWSGRAARFAVLALGAGGIAGCAWSPVEPYAGDAPKRETLYVIASGWHTEIGLPAETLSGPLASLRTTSTAARFFVFGWGQRDYYMAKNPGLGDLLAAVLPASAVMLVIPADRPPADFFAIGTTVVAVPIAREGADRLSQFLWDYLKTDASPVPRPIGDGPYPGSSFYASSGTYNLGNTCNTWTAEALRVSGLPVSATGVVFADQVLSRVQALVR
jgi:uncharacterized protein (TIGR02117 family)